MENPLLKYKNDTPDSFIRFDLIKDEHFEEAFEVALKNAKQNLQNLVNNSESPTFENTIEAMENISLDLDQVSSIFFFLKEAKTSKTIDDLAQKIAPQIADFVNDITFNEHLFERVKKVYENIDHFNGEQKRLLEKTYKGFIRNGALLDKADKELIRKYDQELSVLTNRFGDNLLKATNSYELHITDEQDLSGLPDRIKISAKEEAESRNKDGWVFTLKAPSMGAFLKYADNADLRKQISLATSTRCMSGEYDNKQIVLDIVKLRKKVANILGYPSHAHFVLDDRMAKTPKKVEDFFETLYTVSRPLAEKDFEMLRDHKEKLTGEKDFFPWDTAYYEEKLRKEKFDLDEEVIRPYLEINAVVNGVFEHANRLYDLSFSERKDIPVYHEDVKVFEVFDKKKNSIGILYMDLHPRDSKRGGAFMDNMRIQHKKDGINIKPHIGIVANLTKPSKDSPSLLNQNETETIFHEFGHALHGLLSDCYYKSLSSTNVLWDFVELPSQLMESWLLNKESYAIFAKHYKTRELLSESYLNKMLEADRFMSAWTMLVQLGASVLDMAWHREASDSITDIEEFEEKIRGPYKLFKIKIPGSSSSTSFKHIFNGGYSAGYYSYHWAEVLAADAFEYFKEKGIFSKEVAGKFRANILSKGNTEEPLELYRKFRGREADPQALFRHKGLI